MEVEFQVREKSIHNGESVTCTLDFSVVNVRPRAEYKCVECGISFTIWSHFQRHLLVHGDLISKDNSKGQSAVLEESLLQKGTRSAGVMVKEIYLLKKKIASCNESNGGDINKDFNTKNDNGVNDGSDENDTYEYQCGQCDKRFKNSYTLKAHSTIHKTHSTIHKGDAGVYNCSSCDKSFAYESQLKSHARCHFEKTFICKICGKGFNRSFGLKSHFETHKGNKEEHEILIEQAIKEGKGKNKKIKEALKKVRRKGKK